MLNSFYHKRNNILTIKIIICYAPKTSLKQPTTTSLNFGCENSNNKPLFEIETNLYIYIYIYKFTCLSFTCLNFIYIKYFILPVSPVQHAICQSYLCLFH